MTPQTPLREIAARVPDGAVCVLPNLPACGEMRAALATVVPGKLPPALTFRRLSAAVRMLPDAPPEKIIAAATLAAPDVSDDDNALEIYSALRDSRPSNTTRRSPAADMRLASDIAALFRELDSRNLKLPASESETLSALAAADSPAARDALSAQSRELFYLWKNVFARDDSSAAKHRRALARLADAWDRPLIVVGPPEEREPDEASFCERVVRRGGECVVATPEPSPAERFARAALNGDNGSDGPEGSGSGTDSAQDIASLREHFEEYCEGGAASLSAAAELAVSAAAKFSRAGAKSIGVVVLDRVLARRMNAALRNIGARPKDEAGWRAGTLAFGAALRLLTDAGADSFSPDSFGEWLRVPPLFADRRESRIRADAAWRTILQNDSRLPSDYDALANADVDDSLREAATALGKLRGKFGGSKPLSEWLRTVCGEAEPGGALHAWRGNDPAADRVLAMLAREMESQVGNDNGNGSGNDSETHPEATEATGGSSDSNFLPPPPPPPPPPRNSPGTRNGPRNGTVQRTEHPERAGGWVGGSWTLVSFGLGFRGCWNRATVFRRR